VYDERKLKAVSKPCSGTTKEDRWFLPFSFINSPAKYFKDGYKMLITGKSIFFTFSHILSLPAQLRHIQK